MKHRVLGTTGVRVSELCLGAMMLGGWGNTDHDDSTRIVHAALDAGVNFVDTADVYGGGESEEILAKALAGRREDVVLATKCHLPMGDEINHQGHAVGSSGRARTACVVSTPTTSTSSRSIASTRTPITTRRSVR
jgi:aryl-alcohol dehydrogenase-like predicted oxidoreductase